MSNAVQKNQNTQLVDPQELNFTQDQIRLLKEFIARDLTEDEFKQFCYAIKRTKLDPFMKQIYAIKRKGKMCVQTAIDGYRLIADRTGVYAGSDDPIFDNEQEPSKATITVYKMVQGVRCPFTASARWTEYYPGGDQAFMWDKMPCTMLGKVAEALALRKGFPADLSGIYTDDEMAQAGPADHYSPYKEKAMDAAVQAIEGPKQIIAPKSTPTPSNGKIVGVASEVKPTEKQLYRLYAIMKSVQATREDMLTLVRGFGKTDEKEINRTEYDKICSALEKGEWGEKALSPNEPPQNEIPLPDDADLPWDQADRYELVK